MEATLHFKLDKAPAVIPTVLQELGWTEHAAEHEPLDWSIFWKSRRPKPSEFSSGLPYQRFNHFPKTAQICRKDTLCRLLRKMRAVYGSIYNFIPQTFLLPNEYTKFVQEFTSHDSRPVWICKPNDLSRGRKIFIFRELTDLIYDTPVVVQRYIEQPLLIGNFKWDLRVYVLITSFHPLTVYIYREGLARFSTERYDLANLENKFSHLTNSSINKLSPHLYADKKVIGSGSKWTFAQLNNYLQGSGVDIGLIWKRIEQIIVLTLLPLAPQVPEIDCCFELLGYDVILDQTLKPWLLEINASPALAVECDIDVSVKSALLTDMMELLQFKSPQVHWVLSR